MDIVRRARSMNVLPLLGVSPKRSKLSLGKLHGGSQGCINRSVEKALRNISWSPILGGSRYEINQGYVSSPTPPVKPEIIINVIDTGLFY